jgi:hypothetical protein
MGITVEFSDGKLVVSNWQSSPISQGHLVVILAGNVD